VTPATLNTAERSNPYLNTVLLPLSSPTRHQDKYERKSNAKVKVNRPSALEEGECSASRPGRLYCWLRGWVGPRAGLDIAVVKRTPCPLGVLTPIV